MKRALLILAVLLVSAMPAHASSVTINNSNCTPAGGCFGLAWTLTVNTGSYTFGGTNYQYQAFFSVQDDTLVAGTPNTTISAVTFKASNSVSKAVLYSSPASTLLNQWSTFTKNLSSNGCTGGGAGFVCSQSSTSPAKFVASSTPQVWAWYFNGGSLFAGLNGAHIGAKLTTLNKNGQLLSQTFVAQVPEPGTFAVFLTGLVVAGFMMVRSKARETADF